MRQQLFEMFCADFAHFTSFEQQSSEIAVEVFILIGSHMADELLRIIFVLFVENGAPVARVEVGSRLLAHVTQVKQLQVDQLVEAVGQEVETLGRNGVHSHLQVFKLCVMLESCVHWTNAPVRVIDSQDCQRLDAVIVHEQCRDFLRPLIVPGELSEDQTCNFSTVKIVFEQVVESDRVHHVVDDQRGDIFLVNDPVEELNGLLALRADHDGLRFFVVIKKVRDALIALSQRQLFAHICREERFQCGSYRPAD